MFSPFNASTYIMCRCKSRFSLCQVFFCFLVNLHIYFLFNFCLDPMFSMGKLIRLFHFGILSFSFCFVFFFFCWILSVCHCFFVLPLFVFTLKKKVFFFHNDCVAFLFHLFRCPYLRCFSNASVLLFRRIEVVLLSFKFLGKFR